jgi:5,5'-dehydrodivanillate O-demethylase
MLSVQENDAVTRVGKGAPMGELMRRYWHPIAAAAELDERPTKKIRLMGENLVLYKDRSGTLGLIDLLCAHRRVDLSYGIPEEHGLRCMYHGWLYDETGQCIEQPFEETVHPDGRFKGKVKLAGYAVKVAAGLVFAYLGPQPVPMLPMWEPLTWDNAIRDIAISHLDCNWLQCQENSLDPVHVQWMHVYYGRYTGERGGWNGPNALLELPKHQKIGFDEFEHGIVKRRVFEGYTEEDDDWKHGHPVFFPNILMVGSEVSVTFQWRVPIDDEHTYHVSLYTWRGAPGAPTPTQEIIPYREVQLKDDQGRWVVDLVFNQDYMAWATQGPIAARDKEKLGASDAGIIMFRKQLSRELEVVADGGEPMNVFRDANKAACIRAPLEQVKFGMRRAKKYIPGESGYSADADKINAVLKTWEALPELASAPGAGEGEESTSPSSH